MGCGGGIRSKVIKRRSSFVKHDAVGDGMDQQFQQPSTLPHTTTPPYGPTWNTLGQRIDPPGIDNKIRRLMGWASKHVQRLRLLDLEICGDKFQSNLSRMIMVVWLFVVLTTTQIYLASLASMLIAQGLQPTIANVDTQHNSNPIAGYCRDIAVAFLKLQVLAHVIPTAPPKVPIAKEAVVVLKVCNRETIGELERSMVSSQKCVHEELNEAGNESTTAFG